MYASLASLMASRDISISRTPFNPDIVVIKRASFPKGEIPPHLRSYLIPSGTGRGMTGTGTYHGKRIPKTAINIAQRYRGGRRGE
jgi:hypothetical protein